MERLINAIRNLPGLRPTSSRYGRFGSGATYGAPISAPCEISRNAALSRTLLVITCGTAHPFQPSEGSGPRGIRPRVGLKPNRPQADAGIRSEPPASPPWAVGTIPAATAAAAP